MKDDCFKLKANYRPKGDQPEAIDSLLHGLNSGLHKQTLLGVTGSGKTFTIANLIEKSQERHSYWLQIRPSLLSCMVK